MIAPLVTQVDTYGTLWRLALDDGPSGVESLVVLEFQQKILGEVKWVHHHSITSDAAQVGVIRRHPGVIIFDDKLALGCLLHEMTEAGHTPQGDGKFYNFEYLKPGRASMPWPRDAAPHIGGMYTLDNELPADHERANLLEFILHIEAEAATQLDGDPRAPRPLIMGALVRKLRDAFYLLQDNAQLIRRLRGLVDGLLASQPVGHELSGLDSMISTLTARMASFPTIEVPAVRPAPAIVIRKGERIVRTGSSSCRKAIQDENCIGNADRDLAAWDIWTGPDGTRLWVVADRAVPK